MRSFLVSEPAAVKVLIESVSKRPLFLCESK